MESIEKLNPEQKLLAEIEAGLETATIITRPAEGAYIHEGAVGEHAVKLTAFESGQTRLEIDGQEITDPNLIAKIIEHQRELKL